jgi:hypothetical protein
MRRRVVVLVDGIHWSDRHSPDHPVLQPHQCAQLEGHRSTSKVVRTSSASDRHYSPDRPAVLQPHQCAQLEGHRSTSKVARTSSASDRHSPYHPMLQPHQCAQLEGHRSTSKVVLGTSASLICPSLLLTYKINMLENKTIRLAARPQPALHSNLIARLRRRPSPREESRLMSSTSNKRLLQEHCPSQSRTIAAAGMLRPELNTRLLRPSCSRVVGAYRPRGKCIYFLRDQQPDRRQRLAAFHSNGLKAEFSILLLLALHDALLDY